MNSDYSLWRMKVNFQEKKTDFLPGLTRLVDYRTGNLIKTL